MTHFASRLVRTMKRPLVLTGLVLLPLGWGTVDAFAKDSFCEPDRGKAAIGRYAAIGEGIAQEDTVLAAAPSLEALEGRPPSWYR